MAEKEGKTPKGKKRKQKDEEESQDSQEESFVVDDDEDEGEATPAAKKQKLVFKIPSEWAKLIAEDTKNAKTWAQVSYTNNSGSFLSAFWSCVVFSSCPIKYSCLRLITPFSD